MTQTHNTITCKKKKTGANFLHVLHGKTLSPNCLCVRLELNINAGTCYTHTQTGQRDVHRWLRAAQRTFSCCPSHPNTFFVTAPRSLTHFSSLTRAAQHTFRRCPAQPSALSVGVQRTFRRCHAQPSTLFVAVPRSPNALSVAVQCSPIHSSPLSPRSSINFSSMSHASRTICSFPLVIRAS